MAVNHRLIVRHAGFEGRGNTENLSERGAMLSVDIDPAVNAGDLLELEFELPQVGTITVGVTVRWVSAVLPGMVGVEFNPPVVPELSAHIALLVAERRIAEAKAV